jgi:hypothetical protein
MRQSRRLTHACPKQYHSVWKLPEVSKIFLLYAYNGSRFRFEISARGLALRQAGLLIDNFSISEAQLR